MDPFMMDLENWILANCWDEGPWPLGPDRWQHPVWATIVQQQLADSDSTWDQYCKWVSGGGGDEWFDLVNGRDLEETRE